MTSTATAAMVPAARDAIDFSFLPPMTHAELERRVTEVQDVLAIGTREQRDGVLGGVMARDRRVREAFFASFAIGYGLEPMVLAELASRSWASAIPAAWVRDGVFDDDANFVPEQFYLAVYNKKFTDRQWQTKAVAQARRLLAAGRVDPEYLRVLTSVEGIDFGTELLVYLDEGDSSFKQMIGMARNLPGLSTNPRVQEIVEQNQAKMAEFTAERERVFHEVWLPGILPAAEWAAVQAAPRSMLRDLYSALWEQGYRRYRAAIIAKAAN